MAQPILTFITTFDRIAGKIVVTDTTNYLSYGINLATLGNFVNGRLRITYTINGGVSVLYDNLSGVTPDIELVGGVLVWNGDINIPLTTTGLPLPAEYTVEYVVECGYDNNGDDFVVNTSNTYTYNIVDPSICIETSVDCATSTATSVDTTVYEIQNATVDYILRSHTQFPPPASGYAVNGPYNLITVTYTPIVTTTWTAEVISTVNYLLTSGLYVVVNLSGVKEFQVICDTNLSKILCCLTDLQKQYEALECSNPVKAANFRTNRLDPTLQHLVLFLAAQTSGNQTKMAQQYAAIIEVSGCSESCNCNGTTPTAVSPSQSGPAALFIVNSPLGTIQVQTTINGTLTTYSLELSAALQAAIAAIDHTVVTTGTPAYLDLTSNIVGNTTTYNIDYIPTGSITYTFINKRILIDTINIHKSPPAPQYMDFVVQDVVSSGSNVGLTPTYELGFGSNYFSSLAVFSMYDLLDNPTTYFTVEANIMSLYAPVMPTAIANIAVEVLYTDMSLGYIYLRLFNPITGHPYTLGDLSDNNYGNIYINLTIISN